MLHRVLVLCVLFTELGASLHIKYRLANSVPIVLQCALRPNLDRPTCMQASCENSEPDRQLIVR